MALLLMAYYLVAKSLEMVYPGWVITTMLIGGAMNPFTFIIVAMRKPEDFRPGKVFKTITMLSFTITTLGFAAAAILVAF
jgi:hypothetical protein